MLVLQICPPLYRHCISVVRSCDGKVKDSYTQAHKKKIAVKYKGTPHIVTVDFDNSCNKCLAIVVSQLAQLNKKPNTTWQPAFIYVARSEATFTACIPIKYTIKMAREAWQVVSIFCSVLSGGPSGLNAAYLTALLKQ